MLFSQSIIFYFYFIRQLGGGVWIFFILSGFLSALGFQSQKYTLSLKGIIQYYYKKIHNIYFPTIIFIFISIVLSYPDFFVQNKNVIFQFLYCGYNGIPGAPGIGATWFVFTLMWLYFISPIVALLFNPLSSRKKLLFIGLLLCIFSGLAYRFLCYYFQIDWYSYCYTSVIGCVDLYFSGFIFSYLTYDSDTVDNEYRGFFYSIILVIFVLLNSYLYSNNLYIELYQFLFPTIYILILLNIIRYRNIFYSHEPTYLGTFVKWVCGLSFYFYLFHSLVLGNITKYIGGTTATMQYFRIVGYTILFTLILSISFKRCFKHV